MLIQIWILALAMVFGVTAAVAGFAYRAERRLQSWPLGVGLFLWTLFLVGTIAAYSGPLFLALLATGIISALPLLKRHKKKKHGEKSGLSWQWLWLVFPILYFTTRFFTAGLPHEHVDPLYYHLGAAKLWYYLGQIQLTPEHPSYSYAGLWDAIYGIPVWFSYLVAGGESFAANVFSQISGQWLHVVVGQLGCALIASRLLRKWFPELAGQREIRFFLGWLATSLPGVDWQGGLAKNDYLLIFFTLAMVVALTERRPGLAGFFWGLSFATKPLAVLTLPAFAAYALSVPELRRPRAVSHAAVAALLGALPLVLRNLLWAKNPLFPSFDDVLGPGWVNTTWLAYHKSFGGSPAWNMEMLGWMREKFFFKALPKILIVLGTVGFAAASLKDSRRELTERSRWLLFHLVALGTVFVMVRPVSDGRYGSMVEVLFCVWLAGLAVSALINFARKYPPQKAATVALALLPLGLLINIPLEQLVKIPRDFWFAPTAKYVETFHQHYPAKKWINENTPEDAEILFLADKFNFYLERDFQAMAEMRIWQQELPIYKTAREFLETLRERGYRWVHLSPPYMVPEETRGYWKELLELSKRAPYRTKEDVVFDLEKI